jgi:hypothetical protein
VKRLIVIVASLATVVGAASSPAQDEPRRVVFSGGNSMGELWANVGLTVLRLDEDYIPMVVAVVNRARNAVVVDRDSIRLVTRNGERFPMPTLKELRKGYRRSSIDARTASGAGIPYLVWRSERRLMESNFFPNLQTSRRAIAVDEITLAPGYALLDLVYFAKPPGLQPGEPLLLEVQADGWEAPVRLGIVLN